MKLDNINILFSIVKKAGEIILSCHQSSSDVKYKSDDSPVTKADVQANQFIVEKLTYYFPHIPVISEESECNIININEKYFWLVDPLDGTRSFVKNGKDYTVNIALIKENLPLIGIIYHPVSKKIFYNFDGENSFKINSKGKHSIIKNSKAQEKTIIVIGSHSSKSETQLSNFLSQYDSNSTSLIIRDSSIKFCLLADGKANIYPRYGKTMEWDTAAGHIILKGAGGIVLDLNGEELKYNKDYFTNNGFIAFANKP